MVSKRAAGCRFCHLADKTCRGYSKTRYKRLQSLIENHMSAVCLLEIREQIDTKAISNVLGFVSEGSISSSSTRGEEITVDTWTGAQAASVGIKFCLNTPLKTSHPHPHPHLPPLRFRLGFANRLQLLALRVVVSGGTIDRSTSRSLTCAICESGGADCAVDLSVRSWNRVQQQA